MLGNRLVTIQSGAEGKTVGRVLVEAGCDIARELYLGIVIDRTAGLPILMTSPAGGMNIEQVAAENDREIEDDHYGVLIPYATTGVPEQLLELLARRRPDIDDVTALVPTSWEELARLISQFVDVGTT